MSWYLNSDNIPRLKAIGYKTARSCKIPLFVTLNKILILWTLWIFFIKNRYSGMGHFWTGAFIGLGLQNIRVILVLKGILRLLSKNCHTLFMPGLKKRMRNIFNNISLLYDTKEFEKNSYVIFNDFLSLPRIAPPWKLRWLVLHFAANIMLITLLNRIQSHS